MEVGLPTQFATGLSNKPTSNSKTEGLFWKATQSQLNLVRFNGIITMGGNLSMPYNSEV